MQSVKEIVKELKVFERNEILEVIPGIAICILHLFAKMFERELVLMSLF